MTGMVPGARGRPQGVQQTEPVKVRHHHVGQNQIRWRAPRRLQRLEAVRHRLHLQ